MAVAQKAWNRTELTLRDPELQRECETVSFACPFFAANAAVCDHVFDEFLNEVGVGVIYDRTPVSFRRHQLRVAHVRKMKRQGVIRNLQPTSYFSRNQSIAPVFNEQPEDLEPCFL